MAVYQFGEFDVDPTKRVLSRKSGPVKIGARAFDLLLCFLAKPAEIISKEDLIREIWPSTHVDEVALRVHLVALRKALQGEAVGNCIESVPGRGYKFVRTVTVAGDDNNTSASRSRPSALPAPLENLIGRNDFVTECANLLRTAKLLTVTGPGGIGKTSTAIEIARTVETEFETTIFIDLATLASGELIPAHLASLLGLSVYSKDPLPNIIQTLADQRTLLILDNCEHVILECALITERLIEEACGLTVLATSREALRINSEHVRNLPGLSFPKIGERVLSVSEFSALELFDRRLAGMSGTVHVATQQEMDIAAQIVTRLDGIPLAIELASARVSSLGLQAVLDSLNDPINLLRRGRRTAPQRQQTLRATLEWSYSLLTDHEKLLLAHLSVFAGTFTSGAANAISPPELDPAEFDEALSGLAAKSLISISRHERRFRLLEVTRAFAKERLRERAASSQCYGNHAFWVKSGVDSAVEEWSALETSTWLAKYGDLIHDVRIALRWAFQGSDSGLALKIVASSHLLWTQLGLMAEYLSFLETAVAKMGDGVVADELTETRLRASYASAMFHLNGLSSDDEALDQFRMATRTAEISKDPTEIVRTHSGICAILTTHGRYQEAIDIAETMETNFGPIAANASSRIRAINEHYAGQLLNSEALCEKALDAGSVNVRNTRTSGAGYDQKLLALMVMAKNAWLRGHTETALTLSREVVAEAVNMDDPISSCLVLATSSCPLYFGMEQEAAGRHHVEMLHEISARHSLARWQEWADGYQLVMDKKQTSIGFDQEFAIGTTGPRLESAAVAAGERIGLRLVEFALSNESGWCRSELLRLKGELVKSTDVAVAKELFEKAYDIAQQQGARLWELRSACSLLDIAVGSERSRARERLENIVETYPEKLARSELRRCGNLGIGLIAAVDAA
jgi:predicted ATPase/DNA-binding winged helix-turn-helix (wHTH) protein